MTPKIARQLLLEARRLQSRGVNPAIAKRREGQANAHASIITFRGLGEASFVVACAGKSESYRTTMSTCLHDDVYPVIRNRPIKAVEPADVLTIMRRFEMHGALHSAERGRSLVSQGAASGYFTRRG